MTQGVLNPRTQLAKGPVILGDEEQRVVAEAAGTARLAQDHAVTAPFYGSDGGALRIRQDGGANVISVAAVTDDAEMLSISEHGFGKRTELKEYRVTSQGGKGIINMKTSDRNGLVVAVLPVNDESQILIITNQGKLSRMGVRGIRVSGRSTQGVKLIDASDGDLVSSASLIERQQDATEEPVS